MKIAIVFSQSGALNFFTYMIIHGIAARGFLTFFLLRCFYRLIIRRVFLNCFGNWHGPMQLPTLSFLLSGSPLLFPASVSWKQTQTGPVNSMDHVGIPFTSANLTEVETSMIKHKQTLTKHKNFLQISISCDIRVNCSRKLATMKSYSRDLGLR